MSRSKDDLVKKQINGENIIFDIEPKGHGHTEAISEIGDPNRTLKCLLLKMF